MPSPVIPPISYAAVALREQRKKLNLSQDALAFESGLSQTVISELERGVHELQKMEFSNVVSLANALKLSLPELENLTAVALHKLDYPNQKYTPLAPPNNAIAHEISIDSEFDWYPVYSFASASLDATQGGEPFIVDYRRLETSRMPRGYTLFRVQGDSMQPTVYDGEDMRVNTNNTKLSDDDIYLLAIPHGQVCVKRVRYLDGEWWMFSDHPDQKTYRPQKIPDGTLVRGHCESKFPVEQPMK